MRSAAVLFTGRNAITVGEVDLPEVGPNDVLIRTECSFISTGTERWTLRGKMSLRKGGAPFPIVPGYQKVGYVEEVGQAVTTVHGGQRVFMTRGSIKGATSRSGGHMQYALENENEVYALPEQLPSDVAAALVVVQVGWNNAQRPSLVAGDLAVVVGDGIIGQFTAQALRARGAEVWLAGRHRLRLDLGRHWSADRVVNTKEENLLEAVQAARPSGADVVVETVSQPEETPLYIQMLRREGQFVIAGYHPETNWVDLAPVQDKALTCHTTGGFTRARMEATLADLIAGKFHVAPLITHRVPWREAASAYERLVRDKAEDSLGIVIDWR
jgi:2-desacetyl-2-hydroxyethyl bacteriochlorophyllide A dehydrogenase